MNKFGYVYKTTNILNGQVYIGLRSGNFIPRYTGSGTLIIRAVKKYGKKMFSVQLLDWAKTQEELNDLEKFYIRKFRKLLGKDILYNISEGGYPGGMKGLSHSEEFKERQRQRASGKRNQFCKFNWSGKNNGMFGRRHSEETKKKMSLAAKLSQKNGGFRGNHTPRTKKQIDAIKKANTGKPAWNRGISHTLDARVKMSVAAKRRWALCA